MKTMVRSIDISAPAESVWGIVSDIEHGHAAIPAIRSIEILGDRSTGLGTRWRETRVMFGREATETMEITGWDPPREYIVSARNHGCDYRSAMRVVPQAAGCRLEFEFGATPLTFAAKLMGGLMAPLMSGAIRRALDADLAALKAHCEKHAGGAR